MCDSKLRHINFPPHLPIALHGAESWCRDLYSSPTILIREKSLNIADGITTSNYHSLYCIEQW